MADTLSFSLSYTSKLFKKFTGITFIKYLNSVRIRASLEDLLEGIKNISEISDECGMPNSKAYTEAFKEIYGISPSNREDIHHIGIQSIKVIVFLSNKFEDS